MIRCVIVYVRACIAHFVRRATARIHTHVYSSVINILMIWRALRFFLRTP